MHLSVEEDNVFIDQRYHLEAATKATIYLPPRKKNKK